MRLAVLFATALLVAYSGALMPGPLLTMVIAESARRGARAGPLAVVGHGILELLLLVGLAVGLTQVFTVRPVSAAVGGVGGAVMLWMGVGMMIQAARNRVELNLVERGSGSSRLSAPGDTRPVQAAGLMTGFGVGFGREELRLVGLGALISLLSPFWSIWWATIGAAYVVSAAAFGVVGIAVFFAGHILADLSWYSLVSASVAYGRRFLGPGFYRWLIFACGLFLVGLACYFVGWSARMVM